MVNNQTFLILLFSLVLPFGCLCQETTLFTVSDFDLKGKVKSCLVSTDYGKEEYSFNEKGFLTESVTRFSDTDYNITSYKYRNGELLEKRIEQYRDNTLDRATSMAHIYTIDTVGNRNITEKILTYSKDFLEQNEYFYTVDDKLSKIVRTNTDGIDEISVVYSQKNTEETANYFLNSELQKSIHTRVELESDTLTIKTVRTKKFFEGVPNTAVTEVFNNDGKISSETKSLYDTDSEKFISTESLAYSYGPLGVVEKTISKKDNNVHTKEYLYQFDPSGNWVKQIITPDNTYKTRKITYYEISEGKTKEE